VIKLVGSATTRFGKLLRLPSAERWLVAEAALVLAMIRLGLWLLPLWRLQSVMTRASRRTSSGARTAPFPTRVGSAVTRASAYVPRSTCLTQALAVNFLLERRGYSSRLCIGLARTAQKRLEGHAWVEHQGEVIGSRRFSPEIVLPSFEGERLNG
jgi:hypothetical protein